MGVTSNRFTDDPLDNQEYHDVVIKANVPEESTVSTRPPPGEPLSVDSSVRPSKGRRTLWNESGLARSNLLQLLVSIITVEAGKGTAMLWETDHSWPGTKAMDIGTGKFPEYI